jgi:hypothetical protein
VVTGIFYRRDGLPVQGLVRFTPGRLWVVVDTITWACLAPTVSLEDGRFTALLTATDSDSIPFTYLLETPAGVYETYVPFAEDEYHLPDLISHHGVKLAS